jgi:hypothetical protein
MICLHSTTPELESLIGGKGCHDEESIEVSRMYGVLEREIYLLSSRKFIRLALHSFNVVVQH